MYFFPLYYNNVCYLGSETILKKTLLFSNFMETKQQFWVLSFLPSKVESFSEYEVLSSHSPLDATTGRVSVTHPPLLSAQWESNLFKAVDHMEGLWAEMEKKKRVLPFDWASWHQVEPHYGLILSSSHGCHFGIVDPSLQIALRSAVVSKATTCWNSAELLMDDSCF